MHVSTVDERSLACFATIKTIIEVLVGKEIVPAADLAGTLREQAKVASEDGLDRAAGILKQIADFAADPKRASARHLLNEPPLGSA